MKGAGKAWWINVAASQETYLTDKTTYPTEGKGGYYEKRHEKKRRN
jgi:hypothetical protein